jgi:murein DD-endopeptidase MepM/ murein hydrolase activator NlpD
MKFELTYPCAPHVVNQGFGVNAAYYQAHIVDSNGKPLIKAHNGLDLKAKHGQPVYAAHEGIAYFETDANGGEGVVVITSQPFDYKGSQAYFKSIYWHFCDYGKEPQFKSPVLDYQQKNAGKPMPVKKGDLIGYADNTGLSTGDHCHFGLKPIKPGTPFADTWDAADVGIGNWVNVENSNGYLGAIDPTPYFNGHYANEPVLPLLDPADAVAVIAAQKQAEGNKTLADQLWAIVGLIKAFLGRK